MLNATDARGIGAVVLGAADGDEAIGHLARPVSVLVIATVLIMVGVTFERLRDALHHATSHEVSAPIVNSLFGELSLLGFIGICLFLVVKTRVLTSLSRALLGDDGGLESLVEQVHMVLFLVMVLFLGKVLLLVHLATRLTMSWRHAEVECRDVDSQDHCIDVYSHRLADYVAGGAQAQQARRGVGGGDESNGGGDGASGGGAAGRRSLSRRRSSIIQKLDSMRSERAAKVRSESAFDHSPLWCSRMCPALERRRQLNRARSIVAYASLRLRLISPDTLTTDLPGAATKLRDAERLLSGSTAGAGKLSTAEIEAAASEGRLTLTEQIARRYRKKFAVHAFQSADPVRVMKYWGLSEGQGDDWVIVGANKDVYCCPKDEFDGAYEPVPNRPHQYRKPIVILARKIPVPFCCKIDRDAAGDDGGGSDGGDSGDAAGDGAGAADASIGQRGLAGSFLVQTPDGKQYCMSEAEFEATYEALADDDGGSGGGDTGRIGGGASSGAARERDASEDLPADFDAAEYLSRRLGIVLAEIVEVKLHTWAAVWVVVALFWGVFITVPEGAFNLIVIAMGYTILGLVMLMLRKLRRTLTMLTSPLLFRIGEARAREHLASRFGASDTGAGAAAVAGTGKAPAAEAIKMGHMGGRVSEPTAKAAPPAVPVRTGGLATAGTPLLAQVGAAAVAASAPVYIGAGGVGGNPGVLDSNDVVPTHLDANAPAFEGLPPVFHKEGTCARRCCGRSPNAHERLFWCGSRGPAMMMEMVRTLILCSSLYVSVAATMFTGDRCTLVGFEPGTDGAHTTQCVAMFAAAVVPLIATGVAMPRVIRRLVMASSVEALRKSYTITEVKRAMKTRRAMHALHLLSAMRLHVKRLERMAKQHAAQSFREAEARRAAAASPGGGGGDADSVADSVSTGGGGTTPVPPAEAHPHATVKGLGAAQRIARKLRQRRRRGTAVHVFGGGSEESTRYKRRRAQVAEVFSLFDRNGDGFVSESNMVEILEMLGHGDEASEHARLLVAECDVDGDGVISLDEFIDYAGAIKALELNATLSASDVSRSVFDLIDRDHNGRVSVEELRTTLHSLGEVLSHDDVVSLVHEADTDGNGTVEFDEFSRLLQRHLM